MAANGQTASAQLLMQNISTIHAVHMLAWTPRLDASPTWTLTTVLFVAVVRAVVVIVAPPDGGDAPPVVALKLSILTLIRRWREREIKEKGGSGSTRISNNVADALKSVVQLPFANE